MVRAGRRSDLVLIRLSALGRRNKAPCMPYEKPAIIIVSHSPNDTSTRLVAMTYLSLPTNPRFSIHGKPEWTVSISYGRLFNAVAQRSCKYGEYTL